MARVAIASTGGCHCHPISAIRVDRGAKLTRIYLVAPATGPTESARLVGLGGGKRTAGKPAAVTNAAAAAATAAAAAAAAAASEFDLGEPTSFATSSSLGEPAGCTRYRKGQRFMVARNRQA